MPKIKSPTLKQICAGLHNNSIVPKPTLGANGYYSVGEDTANKNIQSTRHRLFAVHSGQIGIRVNGNLCRVDAGGFIWISPVFLHDLIIQKGTRVSALDFTLAKNGQPVSLEIPYAWFAHGGHAFSLLAQAARENWGKADQESRTRLKSWLILMLIAIEHKIHRKPSPAFSEGQQMAIADLIARRIHERLSVAQIAERFSLSTDYCSRLFTITYGKSARRHLLEERMKAIARELSVTTEPVGRIALRHGYESLHSFSRLFKQVIGVSPRALRRGR